MTMRLPFSEMRCNSQQMPIHFSLSIVHKYQYTLFVYIPFIRTYIYIYIYIYVCILPSVFWKQTCVHQARHAVLCDHGTNECIMTFHLV